MSEETPAYGRCEQCSVCGHNFFRGSPDRPWIILNRYVIGTGRGCRNMVEAVNEDDECAWAITDNAEDDIASGPLLCWPTCAMHWIDGKMLEAVVEGRKRGYVKD